MKDNVWNCIIKRYTSRTKSKLSNNVNDPDCEDINSPRNVAKRIITGKYNSVITIVFIGMFIISTGIFVLIVKPYDIIFKLKIIFSDGGEIFEIWRVPPVNLYLNVYLWNITNKDAFLRGEEKLKLEEVGPYVYRELMSHENVTFNQNGTISTIPNHPLVWVPELSVGHHEEDQLILPHLALLNIAQVAADASYFTRLGLNLIIRQTKSEPLLQMSPKEFMFGYESRLLTLGNQFLPGWIKFDKLGLIDRMYDFDGDYETVYTGENDMTQSGLIDTYRGSTHIPQWDGYCGNVRGSSDGTKFSSSIKENDTLLFFRKSMCRAKTLIKVNETMHSGFRAYVYKFENNSNDNGHYDPKNKCFCKPDRTCPPPGLLDVHGCYYGFPIALSYPHFYGNPELGKDVQGSRPNRQKHETYFVIQPDSGLPLDLAVRFQINLYLKDISAIANVNQFTNMIMPLLWTETRLYNLPHSLETRFKLYLKVLPIIQESAICLCFVFGILLLCLAIYKCKQKRRNNNNNRDKINYNSSLQDNVMVTNKDWLDDDFLTRMDNKLKSYVPEKRASMTAYELKKYYDSLITSIDDDHDVNVDDEREELTYDEFQHLKEHVDI